MEDRICVACGATKPIEDYHVKSKATGARHSRCKSCMREYSKQHYEANKQTYIDRARDGKHKSRDRKREVVARLKTKPCMDCGVAYPHYVMEFDHRSGEVKVDAIANAKNRMQKWGDFEAELAKCDVVCANCHRARTYMRRFEGAVI
jgi:hypothetical protein